MKNQAELHIKTKEPESEAVMIIQKPDTLQFAREHNAELVCLPMEGGPSFIDDDQEAKATCPVISFNPGAPAGQRFRFSRADEIQDFKDKLAETGAIIKRILKQD